MSTEDKSLAAGVAEPPPPPQQPPEPAAPPPAAATDKRPRGRPRKDGASPFQRARKKPRSRGKTAVEDEDSMDGLEAAETENTVETEVKEQSAEEDAQTEVDSNKQLTPVLQRSVSEESASSTASVGVEAKTSEQLCAFCYCGERSSLGQGELKQFSPTPTFITPWKKQLLSKSETNDSSDATYERTPRQNSVPRKQRGPKKERPRQSIASCTSVSTQTASDDQVVKYWDELSLVGLPDDIDVQALFEPTGHCWAHHRCAEWSLGVCQTEEQLSVNVDKAVVSGSTERCAYCKHLGATIKCCEEKCAQTYHYPCAAGAGTFQDFSNFSLLCPDHIDQAPERSKEEANCAVCDSPGDLLDQLFCTTCGQHYHGMCLDIQVTPLKRAGWQCPDCKVCQNCNVAIDVFVRHSGEDSKMLVCDTCDKGYHTFCLQPVMDSVPTNGWKCKNCRVCAECGTRTSCQWHHNCLVCDNCYQQQDNLPCPFCEKLCHPDVQKDLLHCHICKRWIHIECDKPPGNEEDSQLKDYICTLCKQVEGEIDQTQPCDLMQTSGLTAESGSMTACTNEMDIGGDTEDVAFQEKTVTDDGPGQESTAGCVSEVADISRDEKTVEPEAGVSDQLDTDEMETSPKKTPVSEDSQTEHMMQVTESIQAVTQQESDRQAEEQQLSQGAEISEASTKESHPVLLAPETSATPPETLVSVNKEEASFKIEEQLETVGMQEDVEKKETHESSETPPLLLKPETTPESCANNSSLLGDKPIKSPNETYSSFSSVDISKRSVCCSPGVSLDMHSARDLLHSHTPPRSSSAGNALPPTYISVTPKIGMGKPAITKRKFSPGRPRSRQGAWSTNNTVSPPSWSPDISEGRDIFKSRQLPGSAIWSIKVGRGSGFPGKRRPRGAGLSGRGGRGRSKLKNGIGAVVTPGVTTMDVSFNKDEEENSMHNTVVLFSSSDKFTLHQDMCVVCGSFGQGAEGRLLACSQCGQCYHPYCVSIKITKVVLSKGWRCLECTVCEACGKATDPGRLLLCDDCDISYHTYCLDPPLQTVPKGGWKCKWCVWCRHCGATSPGLRCEWQNNYTQCAPCASLSTCPVCFRNYREEELILQCRQCDRWMHAICQNLSTEEEVENIADIGFDCTMCRPYIPPTNVPSSDCCDPSIAAQIVSKVKELDPPKTYTQDGVCLTELGMSQLQSLTVTVPRRKRTKPKLKLKIINQNSVAVLQTPPDIQSEHSRDGEMDDSRGNEGDLMDCDGKSDSSPERETVDDDTKVTEGADGVKKRKRKPYRPGIGGFMVRQRSRTGQGKTKRSLSRKDSSGSVSEQLPSREDGWTEQLPDTPVDESTPVSENTEKIKKRYRKKKNKLEETFPAYLQEAFFGKDLLDTSRQSKLSLDNLSEESLLLPCKTNQTANFLDPSSDPLLSSASTPAQAKLGAQGSSDDPLADLSEVLNTDDDILGILSDDLVKSGDHSGLDLCTFQVENSPSPFAGLDIGPISDDPSSLPQPSVTQSSRPLSEEQLDGILSPELDKMVTDGAILGKLYKIPELGGKDVEDLFTAVLSPANTQPTPLPQPPPQLIPLHNQGESVFSRVPLMNGLIGLSSHLPHTPLAPGGGLGTFSPITQPPFSDNRDKNPAFNPIVNDPNSSWTPSAPPIEGEGDTMSNAQRSTLKWEKEEALGEMATVAPVLYTNINFPNLKEEFPDWSTRVKQIAKLWRKASSQERAPYVQKARDNRAALRINKVQMSNDSMKRQQQQDSIDHSSRIDSDLFKDPLKQRESEHEQEWKFRQQMRQKSKQQAKIEATQKLEQVKNEQQQQQQQQQFGSQQLLNQSGSDTPSSGIQSPLTPQTGNGNMSPAQQTFHKDLFTKQQLPCASTSVSSDDVFLKPQAPPPPPTPTRIPVQDPLAQPQTPQPSSQQMFPPNATNSRPPSPMDPYAKMVGTPRPPPVNQNFVRRNAITPVDTCPPASSVSRPVQASQNRGTALQGPFVRPPDACSQTPRPAGPPVTESFNRAPAAPAHDPYDQPPMTPRPQPEAFGTSQHAHEADQQRSVSEGNFNASANSPMNSQGQQFSTVSQVSGPAPTSGVTDTQNTMNMSQADTEKLRQRQKLREIILQQQQQKKNAIRQEKALQDPATPPHAAPHQHWQQENLNQIFNRPPPPYPGNIRASIIPPGGPRFTVFPKDQRGPFPADGQFNRPQFPGDMTAMGMRPHGLRFGFPVGGHGPPTGQERFLGPPQQMQRAGVPPQLRRSLSIDMPRPLNNTQMNNPAGLSQHFPPQGIQVQQHNILGQAFIELRHRAPDGRPRLPFNPSAANVIDTAPQHQRHTGFVPRQDFQGPRHTDPVRNNPQGLTNQLQMSTNLEHLPQSQQDNRDHPPVLVMHSLSHPLVNDAFSGTPLPTPTSSEASGNLQIPNQPTDGLEEKLDPDDPSVKDLDVKDLEGVEVKDLDDEDLENLNLDPEDGKGDELDTLDNLETNDPHLDDLLRSGEFDIIAYTDPELDLEDKKSMFNEELDLSVPIDDKLGTQSKTEPKQKEQSDKTSVPAGELSPQKKSAMESEIKTEVLSPNSLEETKSENEKSDGNVESAGPPLADETKLNDGEKAPVQPNNPELPDKTIITNQETAVSSPNVVQGPAQLPAQGVISSCSISGSTPVLSSLLANENSDNSDVPTLGSPVQSLPVTQTNHVSGVSQTLMTPAGQILENTLNSTLTVVPRVNHSFSQVATVNPGFIQGQSTNHGFGTGQSSNQAVTLANRPGPSGISGPQQAMLPQTLAQQQNRERPLLLEEQPLLLQDLLDQERQEQQQQRQMQAMIRQRSEPFFPNIDFDAITDPIMKAKMVALKGINKVMAQSNMGMPPMVMNRFPFMGQPMPGTQTSEGQNLMPQAITQDGSLTPQIARPTPPNFGPGFVNDSQRKQYEEWLQETQQLLQMQQKYLEEQIGVHRKSKKALSAKQRTAKKAGREFPEEDAEQLKHVTEQQSMVQKQLEQIRKQQKEHAELIEEYRIKQQQQCGITPHAIMPGVQSQPSMVPGGTPPAMNQQNFPIVAQQLQHQQHTVVIPGQSNPARMPNLPGWQPAPAPPNHIPLNAPRMQPPMTQLPMNPGTPTPVPGSNANAQSGPPPRVEFDDNNPFSESFQERERKERLREQQERQRIQLMQEVDRQRALQRMEMEQHGMIGSELNNRASLSQIPFFNSDLPCDFMQPPRPLQQSPQQQQQQIGQVLQQGPVNSPPAVNFMQSSERRPLGPTSFGPEPPSIPGGSPNFHSVKQSHGGISGTSFAQNQVRPPFAPGIPVVPPAAGSGLSCGQDTSTPHAPNFPGSSQSLIQLYSDIIPEEKGKKKRTRKKKKDDDAESIKAPSTPHSDITAPPTPAVSDSTSTPTVSTPSELIRHQNELESAELTGSSTTNTAENQPSLELECKHFNSGLLQKKFPQKSSVNPETEQGKTDSPASIQEIKLEKAESDQCSGQAEPKTENQSGIMIEDKATLHPASSAQSPPQSTSTPATKGESGNELLKHLLKNKKSSSLLNQKSENSCRSEESAGDNKLVEKQNTAEAMPTVGNQMQGVFGCGNSQLQRTDVGHEIKKQRNKRTQRTGEKAAPRSKKRKKEEEEKQAIYPNTDTFIQLKQQLSLLPLMEPIIGVSFAHFLPYGSGQLSGGNRLMGSFGSATLDGVSDYYSQLIYKQNNLSNPPTPPASLPPTPPPVACQKMVNGFATTEELAGKAGMLGGHDVTKVLGPKQFQLPFRPQDDLLARAMAQGPKTVDVPASLPTPPHNNQEELRVQDHCDDRDTPDSFVPSSSPESVVGMEVSRYPDLSLVKEETPEPVSSPIIPILPSSTGKGSEAKRNYVKSEPSSGTLPGSGFFGSQLGPSQNGPKSGLISVAITLHPTAAENISSVVAAFSNLLHVRIPNSYEVSNAPDVPSSMGMINNHRMHPALEYRQHLLLHGPQAGSIGPTRLVGSYGLKQPNVPFPPNSNGLASYKDHNQTIAEGSALRPQWCSHCKVVVLGSGVRKSFKDLSFLKQDSREISDRVEKDVVFCSNNCFVLYSAAVQAKNSESKDSLPSFAQSPMKEMTQKPFHQYNNNISTLDVHCLPQLQEKVSPPSSPPITFPPAFEAAKVEAKPDELKVTVKLKPRLKTIHSSLDDCRPLSKKWRGMKWKKWSIHVVIPKGSFKPPGEEEIDEFLKKLGTTLKPDPVPKDYRKCCFCHEEGDGLTDGPARLLNLDLDLWVHLNCALWSTEVYETQAGALINVELALRRGLQMKCMFCHKMGATSSCHRLRCTNIYHFTCAIKAQCMFFKDKTMLCPMHKPKGAHEQELSYFAVFRRVYIQRDEVRQIASIVQRGEREHTFRVGSLIFHTIGQLLPQQMQAFHSSKALFPVGYEASRLYWSMRYANRRCRYLCSIEEKDGFPVFVIRIVEHGHDDLVLTDSTPKGVWDKILETVASVRKDSEMLQLFPGYLKGEDLFGLTVSAVARIAESLPGVEACENYTFRYGRNPLMELPLAINPTGCARAEPKMSTHVKRFVLRPHTLNSTSTSKSFQSTVTGELNAPYSKQFVHSKSSQYRKMKTEWKSNVYLARSRIQGLGLYAARDIEKHTMIIEYIGTIIRNEVANRKEKLYESQNRGVYMFRIDNDHVIDATLTGGPARYINHSCAPNCVAEVVTFERGHKIIISSNRRIQKGEELCYDYKFDFEDDQHKIPCHCGAVNCRKWMN
ncbi:histone-lysine N-methyltransferase 2C isoform X10 [Pelodiscus sinensis]|uniref:histone-lysine N-methyltransferase 2C isoform X10 n=1 Tax=Pelodiscus sinensis TaxID=13735 RepID=UPI003F6D1D49